LPEVFANRSTHWTNRFVIWLETEATAFLLENSKLAFLQLIAAYRTLRVRLLDVTRQIRALSRQDDYKEKMANLLSIPGIGFHTAIVFLTEIGDVQRFHNERSFASYIGLVPTCHSSGEKERTGEMTFRGNKHLCKTLIESSWVAIRHDPALAACYLQYCKRMDGTNAIIRIAHKLSNRILFILKNNTKYVYGTNIQQSKKASTPSA
jgi:transposase